MEYVKRRVGFNEKVVIEAKGRARGLCLMWKNNVQIEVVEFNKYLIAVKILDPGGDWNLVGFYGPPLCSQEEKRLGRTFVLCWSHFKSLGFASGTSTLLWIVKKRMGEELSVLCPLIF